MSRSVPAHNGCICIVDAATIGATSTVKGSVLAGAAVTTGDSATVAGSVRSGAAVTVAANSSVGTFAAAVGAITVGANGSVPSQQVLTVSPIVGADLATALTLTTGYAAAEAGAAKTALGNFSGTVISPTLTVDTTFTSGVYSASALTTTAGTTITLDGQGKSNQSWIFNIADALTTGASTNIVLINTVGDADVFWNIGGFASLGATSEFTGDILANSYVSIGANTAVKGLNLYCVSVASVMSYISIGAGSSVGGTNCSGTANHFSIDVAGIAVRNVPATVVIDPHDVPDGAVPEPATWAMMIAGFAMVGFAMRRRPVVLTA